MTGGYLIDGNAGKLFLCRLESGFYGIMDGHGSDLFRPVSDSLLTNNLHNMYIHFQNEGGLKTGRIRLDLKKSGMTLWATHIDPSQMTPAMLAADYAGSYYCGALGVTYDVIVKNGKLVIRHPRYADRQLQTAEKDEFVGSIGIVRFSRSEHGAVRSLEITDEDTNFKPLIFARML